MGILRAGYICFPISPRNSPAAIANLLNKTSSDHVVVGREQSFQDLLSMALKILKTDYADEYSGDIPVSSMPVFEDLYLDNLQDVAEVPPPLPKTNINDTLLIAHSSGTIPTLFSACAFLNEMPIGSTAFPKPIY